MRLRRTVWNGFRLPPPPHDSLRDYAGMTMGGTGFPWVSTRGYFLFCVIGFVWVVWSGAARGWLSRVLYFLVGSYSGWFSGGLKSPSHVFVVVC